MFASVPDLLRLLAVPFFGYVAWRDVETRRVPNRTWYPLAGLAVALLAWEAYATVGTGGVATRLFAIRLAVSVGIVAPLAYLFWLVGGFGGADAKAFIVLAVLFPTYPSYALGDVAAGLPTLPVLETQLGVFSLTVLSNTVIVGLAYPLVLALRNATAGYRSPGMFVAKPIRPTEAVSEYGSLLHFGDGSLFAARSLADLREYFAWRGLDLDTLRMYLRWRGATLADLRERPADFRDPASLPSEPNDPGDGTIAADGGREEAVDADGGSGVVGEAREDQPTTDDPWGAEAFLADVEGDAWGTDAETLRTGLDALVSEDVVWISPGIPFLVPLFVGLVVAFVYGDLLFGLLSLLGLV